MQKLSYYKQFYYIILYYIILYYIIYYIILYIIGENDYKNLLLNSIKVYTFCYAYLYTKIVSNIYI